MTALKTLHPAIDAQFNEGEFMIKKTCRQFSAIAIDQAHEQNNAVVKGDGGAIGLTENPSALKSCMLYGPEMARLTYEFDKFMQKNAVVL